MNDRFVRLRADDFARRLAREAGEQPEAQVRLAWRLALAREPSAEELETGTAFIRAQEQQRSTRDPSQAKAKTQQRALSDLCQALFAMNEFVYVD